MRKNQKFKVINMEIFESGQIKRCLVSGVGGETTNAADFDFKQYLDDADGIQIKLSRCLLYTKKSRALIDEYDSIDP